MDELWPKKYFRLIQNPKSLLVQGIIYELTSCNIPSLAMYRKKQLCLGGVVDTHTLRMASVLMCDSSLGEEESPCKSNHEVAEQVVL